MNYTLTENNLHIEDSYRVRKKSMDAAFCHIKNDCETPSNVWKRSMFSLKCEWIVHNFLYSLGLWQSHTKDVDLNYPNKWEWLYKIIGVLVWLFVK